MPTVALPIPDEDFFRGIVVLLLMIVALGTYSVFLWQSNRNKNWLKDHDQLEKDFHESLKNAVFKGAIYMLIVFPVLVLTVIGASTLVASTHFSYVPFLFLIMLVAVATLVWLVVYPMFKLITSIAVIGAAMINDHMRKKYPLEFTP
jgi:hypothetical protein